MFRQERQCNIVLYFCFLLSQGQEGLKSFDMSFFSVSPVVVSVLLLTLHQSQASPFNLKKELSDCLEDADYDNLLQTARSGLPLHDTQGRHVAIVGAGMAGLTAAKLLQEAGHQVRAAGCCCIYVVDNWGDTEALNSSFEHLTCLSKKIIHQLHTVQNRAAGFWPHYSCFSFFTLPVFSN